MGVVLWTFSYAVIVLTTGNKTLHLIDYLYRPTRSLERKLQRPILAKSRTLPSIPQSPTVSRVHHSDLIGGSPPRRKNPPAAASHPKACTLPPAGKDTNRSLQQLQHFIPLLVKRVFTRTAAGDFVESTATVWFFHLLSLFIYSLCSHNVSNKSLIRFW